LARSPERSRSPASTAAATSATGTRRRPRRWDRSNPAGDRGVPVGRVAAAASAAAAAGGKRGDTGHRKGQPSDRFAAELHHGPSLLALFALVVRPRVISLSPFSRCLPVIRSAPSRGTGSQYPPTRLRPVSTAHPCRPMTSRPVSYRCYELAEA
jgi:hypothetical protein